MAFTAEEEAALRGIIAIYKSQAPSLSDDVAEIAPALYDQWTGDGHYYTAGERVEHGGTLYVCLQPHTSQADWTPAATSGNRLLTTTFGSRGRLALKRFGRWWTND